MIHPSHINPKKGGQRGTTLVETLVALLVLSIGLLGVAALQVNALQTNHSANVRSQASVLAYDIADRMRANRNVALTGGYNVAFGATPTGSNINQIDLQAWKAALTNTLPSGDGRLSITGDVALIEVQWLDKATNLSQTFETRTQL